MKSKFLRENMRANRSHETEVHEVTNITGIRMFRTGSLTAKRGDSTLSETSTLSVSPHSTLAPAPRDSRLRNDM